jgi:hypothetical protein
VRPATIYNCQSYAASAAQAIHTLVASVSLIKKSDQAERCFCGNVLEHTLTQLHLFVESDPTLQSRAEQSVQHNSRDL